MFARKRIERWKGRWGCARSTTATLMRERERQWRNIYRGKKWICPRLIRWRLYWPTNHPWFDDELTPGMSIRHHSQSVPEYLPQPSDDLALSVCPATVPRVVAVVVLAPCLCLLLCPLPLRLFAHFSLRLYQFFWSISSKYTCLSVHSHPHVRTLIGTFVMRRTLTP